jgi:hypothetical protein
LIKKSFSETLSVFTIISYSILFIANGKLPAPVLFMIFDFIESGKFWGTIIVLGITLIIAYGFRKDPPLLKNAYLHLLGVLVLYIRLVPELKDTISEYANSNYFLFSYSQFFVVSLLACYSKFQRIKYYKKHLQ